MSFHNSINKNKFNIFKSRIAPEIKKAKEDLVPDKYSKYSSSCKNWHRFGLASWFIFIVFEIAIGFDRYYSIEPLCPHDHRVFGEW
jgi:hypothetical protein